MSDAEKTKEKLISELQELRQQIAAQQEERIISETIINSLPGIFYFFNDQGRYLRWNKNLEGVTGYSPAEIAKIHPLDFFAVEDRNRVEKELRNVFVQGKSAMEAALVLKNGCRIPYLFTGTRVNLDGALGLVGMGIDISKRKQAEEKLQRAKSYLENILDNCPDPIGIVNEHGKVTKWNKAVEIIYGYSSEELQGKSFADFYADKGELDRMLTELRQKGSVHNYKINFKRKDGSITLFEISIGLLFDENNKKIGSVSLGRDLNDIDLAMSELEKINAQLRQEIMERRRIEEALQASREYSKSIMDSLQAGVMVVDAETRQIVDINLYAANLLRASKKDLVGMVCHQHICPAEVNKCPVLDLETKMDRAERVMLTTDGQAIPILKTVFLKEDNGRKYLLESFIDLTERKHLESQLLQSQKMEAVGRLAGGVAHDFNNLLLAIMGYSDIAMMELHKTDPIYPYIKEIAKAADRGASLSHQLLAFSRKQILQPRVINLNDVVTDMDRMLRRLIGEDIDLIIVIDPELGQVKADPGQIEQIIMNLVVNARDAMPGGGKLTIETANVYLDKSYVQKHVSSEPGSYALLAVSDDGPGMDAETLSHIFEPFFTTKENGKGTGLGLATVFGIVQQSGGNIWVYSEPGTGTTFKVYLPRVEKDAEASRPKMIARHLKGKETILLVEDDASLRELISRTLGKYGYKVLEAAHGGEALLICEKEKSPIHLMLTDVVMPQMSGRELAVRLASSQPGMEVLFMSGYTENAIVHHGILNSEVNFLLKPFRMLTLLQTVREVLDTDRL